MSVAPLPATFPQSLYRGDTRVWTLTFTEDPVAPATVGVPINITGWVFLSEYRLQPDDASPIAVETCTITDGPNGVMTRTLTATESAKLPAGHVCWDLQATKPDGTVRTYLANPRVAVTGDVSR